MYPIQHYVIKFVSDLRVGRWFSPGTPVSSTNKIDHHEILLKVVLVKHHKKIIGILYWRKQSIFVTTIDFSRELGCCASYIYTCVVCIYTGANHLMASIFLLKLDVCCVFLFCDTPSLNNIPFCYHFSQGSCFQPINRRWAVFLKPSTFQRLLSGWTVHFCIFKLHLIGRSKINDFFFTWNDPKWDVVRC